mmetsp:Transcript_3952/g.2917  ORF Transcript_3952/g.2917 Transcript_3952/m.2917 type:complete len:155 (+) Transcript_3952:28-492(+)
MRKGLVRNEGQDPWSDQFLFRGQNPRSLKEVDLLLRRKEFLRKQLGDELADKIELQPDLYYDHEKFRIWQTKARFRAIISTIIVCPAICVVLNGNKNGIGFMKRNPLISACIWVGTFMTSFFVWHRIVGYNNHEKSVQDFSKVVRMTRNIQIKQ